MIEVQQSNAEVFNKKLEYFSAVNEFNFDYFNKNNSFEKIIT